MTVRTKRADIHKQVPTYPHSVHKKRLKSVGQGTYAPSGLPIHTATGASTLRQIPTVRKSYQVLTLRKAKHETPLNQEGRNRTMKKHLSEEQAEQLRAALR